MPAYNRKFSTPQMAQRSCPVQFLTSQGPHELYQKRQKFQRRKPFTSQPSTFKQQFWQAGWGLELPSSSLPAAPVHLPSSRQWQTLPLGSRLLQTGGFFVIISIGYSICFTTLLLTSPTFFIPLKGPLSWELASSRNRLSPRCTSIAPIGTYISKTHSYCTGWVTISFCGKRRVLIIFSYSKSFEKM